MFVNFKDKIISSIISVIPDNKIKFESGLKNYSFSKKQNHNLKKIMGFKERYVAKKMTVSDLSICGIKYLIKKNY